MTKWIKWINVSISSSLLPSPTITKNDYFLYCMLFPLAVRWKENAICERNYYINYQNLKNSFFVNFVIFLSLETFSNLRDPDNYPLDGWRKVFYTIFAPLWPNRICALAQKHISTLLLKNFYSDPWTRFSLSRKSSENPRKNILYPKMLVN